VPPYTKTADGFELQMGTNHFGHFALTGLLLDILKQTPGSRVVNVSSMAHKIGKIDLNDLHWESRKYKKWDAYGDSKIANLYFTYALQHRLSANGKRQKSNSNRFSPRMDSNRTAAKYRLF
jgi:NAD(P)-dependent dehydrogenase (short-subunit alcohol dehydrogenase family)